MKGAAFGTGVREDACRRVGNVACGVWRMTEQCGCLVAINHDYLCEGSLLTGAYRMWACVWCVGGVREIGDGEFRRGRRNGGTSGECGIAGLDVGNGSLMSLMDCFLCR